MSKSVFDNGGVVGAVNNPTLSIASGMWSLDAVYDAVSSSIWPGTALYLFTTFTFTNAGQTGASGPSLANCLSSYNTSINPWLSNTSNFNVNNGIQIWTVPSTGNYTIVAAGAAGGNGAVANSGGAGANIAGTFALVAGDKIRILVGQMGQANTSYNGGGGGGTFVMKQTGSTNSDIYIIAGGGGGGQQGGSANTYVAGISTSNGQPGWSQGYNRLAGAGGTSANGGAVDYVSDASGDGGGGGGGLIGNGATGRYGATSTAAGAGGLSFVNGGNANTNRTTALGGFGGGGSGDWYNWTGAGGGGGYSGGGGGHYYGAGGGGGSYNNGTNQTNTTGARVHAHGQVIITKV